MFVTYHYLRILDKGFFASTLKIMGISVISVALGWGLHQLLQGVIGSGLAVVVALIAAAVSYFVLGIITNIGILIWLYSFLPEKLRIIRKWN